MTARAVTCHQPDSPQQAAARTIVAQAFKDARHDGLVPKGYTLHYIEGDDVLGNTTSYVWHPGGVINIQPEAIACLKLSPAGAKAVLLHEVGHTQQTPNLALTAVYAGYAGTGLAAYLLCRALGERVYKAVRKKKSVHSRRALLGYASALALAWSVDGALALHRNGDETRADLYSVTAMGEKESAKDVLRHVATYYGDDGSSEELSAYDSAETPLIQWSRLLMAGPAAFVPMHPTINQRIGAIDALPLMPPAAHAAKKKAGSPRPS